MVSKKVKIGGREVEAVLVEANQATERWNEYLLEDGSVLKIKLVLKKVFRVLNQHDPNGNPIYLVESQNVLTTHPPDHLKRP